MNRMKILWGALLLLILFLANRFWINPPSGQPASVESAPLALEGPQTTNSEPLIPSTESLNPAISEEVVSLIVDGEKTDVLWGRRTPAARRVRRIVPDAALLTLDPILKRGDLISLPLFEDAVFSATIREVTRYPNGAVGITVKLQGDSQGTVFLSYCGGELRASVERHGGDDYYVRYDPETKSHYAIQVDRESSDVQEGGEPRIPPSPDDLATDEPLPPEEEAPVAQSDIPAGLPPDTVEVDVMIVYTSEARKEEGGTNGINNNIAMAMEKAHEAHANSDTRVYLNLVHSAETSYTEDGDPLVDLKNLTFTGGVYSAMDEVHTWREIYNADLICLLEDEPNTGGLGWLLTSEDGSPDYAFCLARVQQSDSTYTVVHEWGHNMGCSHSKTQTLSPWHPHSTKHLYSYSAGWQWDDPYPPAAYGGDYIGYCSIMTYEDFDNDGKREYVRVPHFSSPLISYQSQAEANSTGDAADGDNARTMREMRYVLADYRIYDADIDGDGIPNDWETQYYGGPTNANPLALAANGINTILEAYIAGFNPTEPDAGFSVTLTAGRTVYWNHVSGRLYSVYWSTNLLSGFDPIPFANNLTSGAFTDTVHDANSEGFYRLEVELAP